jgi:hypothetical protein
MRYTRYRVHTYTGQAVVWALNPAQAADRGISTINQHLSGVGIALEVEPLPALTDALEQAPVGADMPTAWRHELLLDALAGVDLGAHDRLVLDRLAHDHDTPTLVTIVSLIDRATSLAGSRCQHPEAP